MTTRLFIPTDNPDSPAPLHISPMLATLSTMPRSPELFGYEFKWDGIRAIAHIRDHQLRLESRNGLEISHRYPEFAGLNQLDGLTILDGEIVSLNQQGIPDFSHLQRRMHIAPRRLTPYLLQNFPTQYFIFDVLWWNSRPVLHEPYERRRELLDDEVLPYLAHLQAVAIPPGILGDGDSLLSIAIEKRLEGIMAKELTSPYEPGLRSGAWRKIKLIQKQEFVVGGYLPEASILPNRIGALLLGFYRNGQLQYAGRVGTGFNAADHTILSSLFETLDTLKDPFTGNAAQHVPQTNVHFLLPTIVVEVEYRRWPKDGLLQQASFKGIRLDVSPTQVVKEQVHNDS